MNKYEAQMVEILSDLKANYGVLSVKAEFEAEGTRMDELLRLVDIARSAQLEITVKIGGCEAIRDLLEAKQIGVQNIVAPMVESAYAASKFVSAKNLVYSREESNGVKFLTNLETQLSLENVESIIDAIGMEAGLNGLVFGRVDFVGSRGLDRAEVNSASVEEAVSFVASKLKEANLELVVGGAVSKESLPFLRKVAEIHLSRFETRKVIFSSGSLNVSEIEKGLLNAVHFELLWLLNKKEYYGQIHREDDKRIEMLESRWNILKNAKS
jgi:2-keto-3-deoxy-L-rhamnonate aldolase RhmA